ncbi:PEP-CTERM protein-sorting domain-containing protein [Terrimicrobium sacchariphilum]|uniref:PEP-CTERM protein-sorting domain-containing protein n=1 Tax=Terrimicrobium sacchariphilum TaxID=690879 RepID=A0A146GBW0_TERSA|nr:autotransporter-associated beta strand repeat-containing protein [Terrimicrobium sacchariphilum]GAT34693.1 PEP-CTERM protein-sorting domain-containing protein [Terrimicrobium sacchariphilum]
MNRSPLPRNVALGILVLALAQVAGRADNGTWTSTASGNWSDIANWNSGSGPVANGATYTADFNAGLTGGITITLDADRTIGNLSFTDTVAPVNNYSITGSSSGTRTLTLNANGSGGGTSTIAVNTGTAAIGGSNLVLAGSSSINKTGAGTLNVSTDNTSGAFTGGITVSEGTLGMNAANAFRNVAVTLDSSVNNATLSLNVNAAMNIGSITVAAGGTGTASINYTIANGNTLAGSIILNKSATFNTSSSSVLISTGLISGTGGILKTGAGTLVLRRTNNTFEGGVTVSQGGLRLNGSGKVAGTGVIVLGDANTGSSNISLNLNQNGGAILNDARFTSNGSGSAVLSSYDSDTGGGTTYSGNVQIDRNIELKNNNSSTGRNFTLSGVISGVGGVTTTVASSGNRLVISGSNTYQGGTTVNAGTILVSNTSGSGLGSGNVSVNSGGILGGKGAFTGDVSVALGGTLAPGESIESLASGGVSFVAGSKFAYEVNSSAALSAGADLQLANGNLSLSGTVELTLTNIAGSPVAFAENTTFTLINYSGVWNSGLFTFGGNQLADGAVFSFNGQDWAIDYNATSGGSNFSTEYIGGSYVNITAVPEPTTWVLLGLGLGVVLVRAGSRRVRS